MDDTVTMILAIVGIGVLLLFVGPMVLKWILGKVNLTERPRDAHEMLRKKMLKAGKLNIKGSAIKRAVCVGDSDMFSIKAGKVVGIVPDDIMTQVFIRTRAFRPARWCLVPPEICGHLFGHALVLYCNGITPLGNFYIPIFSRKLSVNEIKEFRKRIDDYENLLITQEENVELAEQRVASWYNAVNAGLTPDVLVTRQDSSKLAPSQEEKKYNEEQT